MDLDDIKRLARAQRQIEHTVALGVTLQLLVPTSHEVQLAAAASNVEGRERESMEMFGRLMTQRCIVGWSGVTARHLLADASEDSAVPWHTDAVGLLLDANPAWEVQTRAVLMDGMERRRAQLEAARGN